MRRTGRTLVWLLAPALAVVSWCARRQPAAAAGDPPRVERQDVHVDIEDAQGLAITTISQEFVNRSGSEAPATIDLPIRDDAAVLFFTVTAPAPRKGETREGLGSIHPTGRNLYRVTVARVPAHGRAHFDLRYAETLTRRGMRRKYVYPIASKPPATFTFGMRITGWSDPQKVSSTSYPVTVRRVPGHTVNVTYQTFHPPDGHDMVIDYEIPPAQDEGKAHLTVLSAADSREDPYCLLTLPPPSNLLHGPAASARPVDVVFCMDVSGSTEGRKANAIREALHDGLTDLASHDRFSVIAFDDECRPFRRALVGTGGSAIDQALRFANRIRPGGGSDPGRALALAADLLGHRTEGMARPAIIAAVVDDEDPANLAEAAARLKLSQRHIRLVTLGAMRDSRLIHYRLSGNRIKRGPAIALSRAAITYGASLAGATLDPGMLNVSYLYPTPEHLPELPLSTPVALLGRLNQPPPASGKLVLTGRLDGVSRSFPVEFVTRKGRPGTPLPGLWANRRVRRLEQLAGSESKGKEDLHAAAETVRSEHGLAAVPGS